MQSAHIVFDGDHQLDLVPPHLDYLGVGGHDALAANRNHLIQCSNRKLD